MNISKTVRDRVILSRFLTHRVVQECPVARGKISIFATFGGHLRFLAENEKSVDISKIIRDRAILSKFLTHRVVQQYPIQRGKISIFATFGVHLGF